MEMSTTEQTITHHSAGGIVYRRDHHQQTDVCIIKDSYGRWTFPKGHLEEGETVEEAAKREISEETGIPLDHLTLRKELGEISYRFQSTFERDGGSPDNPVLIQKYVTYYLFEAPYDTQLSAQEGEVEDITWVPLNALESHNEYEDNVPIINAAKQFLGQ